METPQRILVIGSGLTAAILGVFVLQEQGFEATLAERVESAQALCALAATDLIVLDWDVERASQGWHMLRQNASSVPVIIISSAPLPEGVSKSVAGIIHHSVSKVALVPLIQRNLRARRSSLLVPGNGRSLRPVRP